MHKKLQKVKFFIFPLCVIDEKRFLIKKIDYLLMLFLFTFFTFLLFWIQEIKSMMKTIFFVKNIPLLLMISKLTLD